MTTLPTRDNDSLIAWLRSHHLGADCEPGDAINAFRHDLTVLLGQAAAGRREYAVNAPDDQAAVLEQQASDLDVVARLVAGDMTAMTAWLPSWRWTDDMVSDRPFPSAFTVTDRTDQPTVSARLNRERPARPAPPEPA